jgi:hypothetical protein
MVGASGPFSARRSASAARSDRTNRDMQPIVGVVADIGRV